MNDQMTSSYILVRVIAFLSLFCLVSNASAQTADISGKTKKVAFSVGINSYPGFGGDIDLTLPVADASAVASALKDLHFQIDSPVLNPTEIQFRDKWTEFLRKINPGDTVAVYLSGHGVRLDGVNYFLPSDVRHLDHRDRDKIKNDGIPIHSLFADVATKLAGVTIFVIDACRDDPFVPEEFRLKQVASGNRPAGLNIMASNGVFALYAASPGEAAIERFENADNSQNSLFTKHLLPLLRQPNLTLVDLAKTVQAKVYFASVAKGRKQTPDYNDAIVGHFCLGGCKQPKSNATNLSDLMGTWFALEDSFRIELNLSHKSPDRGRAIIFGKGGLDEYTYYYSGNWKINLESNVAAHEWESGSLNDVEKWDAGYYQMFVVEKNRNKIRLKLGELENSVWMKPGNIVELYRK